MCRSRFGPSNVDRERILVETTRRAVPQQEDETVVPRNRSRNGSGSDRCSGAVFGFGTTIAVRCCPKRRHQQQRQRQHQHSVELHCPGVCHLRRIVVPLCQHPKPAAAIEGRDLGMAAIRRKPRRPRSRHRVAADETDRYDRGFQNHRCPAAAGIFFQTKEEKGESHDCAPTIRRPRVFRRDTKTGSPVHQAGADRLVPTGPAREGMGRRTRGPAGQGSRPNGKGCTGVGVFGTGGRQGRVRSVVCGLSVHSAGSCVPGTGPPR
mmetsp:Transcript_6837/g.19806  ORF Transcript_6837/g.19806 Transcript_6837/m.19806 type:complete len:264 (+) Transcript_6837:54-845(+)